MRIAQIAPLNESVPPKFYGGTERIVSYLSEELVRRGHQVTLFASGDSKTAAELVRCSDRALRLDPAVQETLPYHLMMLDNVFRSANDFDILHFHIDLLHYPLARCFGHHILTTLHGRLDLPDLQPFYRAFPEFPLVSISEAQRTPMPPVNWISTVQHGLPRDLLPFNPEPMDRGYLAFLGRISPEKGPDRAIEIANRTGMPLKIAAKIDEADQAYWKKTISPLVKACPGVEFVGEIGEDQKSAFLGNAYALVFPIDWPEPFGLVMIEAMACGTPVIAFPLGSVPEVVDDGVSGFIVDSVEDAVRAVRQVAFLSRREVRTRFEERFTVERMTNDYVAVYRRLLNARPPAGSDFDCGAAQHAHHPKLRA